MFNDHSMSLITNLNILGSDINNIDFITVAAITTSEYPQLPNIYNAAILMPPTNILMAWADGDPFAMIIALLAALTKKNIILYIPQDEFNIFGQVLLNHLYYQYGITVNFGNIAFNIIPNSIPLIISKFYLMDLMEFEDYIASYPANVKLPPIVINKMAQERQPFNYPASFDQYYEYFNQLNMSKSQDKPPVIMATIVDNK